MTEVSRGFYLQPTKLHRRATISNLRWRPSKAHEKPRATASQRGYGHNWRKLRTLVLAEEPLCSICLVASATEVDHIIPHKGDDYLFWLRKNLQGLCKSCHSKKTAAEDGGFGNRQKPHVREHRGGGRPKLPRDPS
jgi:5-methylcytosine-specific restriction protein A